VRKWLEPRASPRGETSDTLRKQAEATRRQLAIELEQARAATLEAVAILRAEATHNPNEFQPALAANLHSLGIILTGLAQSEPALAAMREAVALYRTLATRNPDEFQPALAASLYDLGVMLDEPPQRDGIHERELDLALGERFEQKVSMLRETARSTRFGNEWRQGLVDAAIGLQKASKSTGPR
jgi:hypothetical protein